MRNVSVIGIGQVEVAEHWDRSLRQLGAQALRAALQDAGVDAVEALYVGNMLSGELGAQEHLGPLIAEHAGLRGVEAYRVEAACGSGGAAMRAGVAAVAAGLVDLAAVVGVEKMTDRPTPEVTAALASASDAEYEAALGLSFVALNALLMRRYMHEFRVGHDAFAPFVVNAHKNSVNNPYAMFRFPVSAADFAEAKMIADPVNLLDSSPVCDGAAAVVLCPTELTTKFGGAPVRVLATSIATDTLALHDRVDPLRFQAATDSAAKAYRQAGLAPRDIDLFEVHDAFSITSVLSLEACGFAERGHGTELGLDGSIERGGRIPISTMGGLKARGHPVGATGVYQIVELTQQLRGSAGENQLARARVGMAQSVGGSAATVATTILGSSAARCWT
jgi:acetyl-CoA C-acetyltransferase